MDLHLARFQDVHLQIFSNLVCHLLQHAFLMSPLLPESLDSVEKLQGLEALRYLIQQDWSLAWEALDGLHCEPGPVTDWELQFPHRKLQGSNNLVK